MLRSGCLDTNLSAAALAGANKRSTNLFSFAACAEVRNDSTNLFIKDIRKRQHSTNLFACKQVQHLCQMPGV